MLEPARACPPEEYRAREPNLCLAAEAFALKLGDTVADGRRRVGDALGSGADVLVMP